MIDVTATTASDVAFGVIIGLSILVMLMPLVGVAFVVRDVVRQARSERRNAATQDRMHEAVSERDRAATSPDPRIGDMFEGSTFGT
jgi:hypothetical protein